MTKHVAVVGAGLGGLRAAEQLRAAGHAGPITIVGAEPHMPYSRPPLSKELLAHELADAEAAPGTNADDLAALHERVAFRRRAAVADVTFRLGAPVTGVALGAGELVVADGELVRFANQGFLVHMIVAARARNLAGARQIARLLKAGKDGPAQKLATGFASYDNALSHGAYEQLVLHSKPGYWVLACFMDTQDHREHTQLGMERVIRIAK